MNTDPIRAREQVQLVFGLFCAQKQKAPCFTRRFQALSPWPRGQKGASNEHRPEFAFPWAGSDSRPAPSTAGRSPSPHTRPPGCRGWVHGRRQDPCPLPKGARPPWEGTSRPLFIGYAAIMLNFLQVNRDGFSAFHHWAALNPAVATL